MGLEEEICLTIRLLGDVQAHHFGRPLPLGGRRAKSVLAVLLLHPGQTVPKRTLTEYAWPDDPPDTVDDLVVAYLSRLRKGFSKVPGFALVSARPGFRAEVDADLVDAHRFNGLLRRAARAREASEDELAEVHLTSALDLWRSNTIALADMDSAWLRAQAAVLEQKRLQALEMLAEVYLATGRAARAALLVRDVAPMYPEREGLNVVLVRALASSGEAAQAAQVAGRAAKALHDLGQGPGPALRSAHTAALTRSDASTAVVGPRHQLPAGTRAFTGRDDELSELVSAIGEASRQRAEKATVCAIDGMGGVGKSALAVHLGRQLADQYSDGQLYIDLRGYTEGCSPRSAGEALDVLLRSLGSPPGQIPPDVDERAILYRERLIGTRTLILLDNAAGEAQVRPLIPGSAGCLVLITCRKRLKALDDAYILSLDPLLPHDAAALFRTVAGPGRVAGGEQALCDIVELCGQLPLAVRIAAALLRHRPAWTLEYLERLLRDRRCLNALTDGDRDLAAVFDLSYATLTDEQRRSFRLLGLLPGQGVEAYAAAALFDCDPLAATRALEDLVDHNLLGQISPGRYQLHDLIRIHARAAADNEPARTRDDATDRLLDFYVSTAQAANRHLARRTVAYPTVITHPPRYQPAVASRRQAAAWMHANLAALSASVTAAATTARSGYVVAMSAIMHGYLYTNGPWMVALSLHTEAAAIAEREMDLLGQATALHAVGRIRRMIGDYPGAVVAQQRAFELYRELGHEQGQANALDALGRVRWLTADYAEAIRLFERALVIFTDIADPLGRAGALNGLGRVWRLTGAPAAAVRAHRLAVDLCDGVGESIGMATALNDLGRAYAHIGECKAALQAQRRALELYREADHRLGQANALRDLGRAYIQNSDHRSADDAFEQALDLYREMGHRLGQASALAGRGEVSYEAGEYSEAAAGLDRALLLFREVGDRQGEAAALNHRARVLTATGSPEVARAMHGQALKLAREIKSPLDEAEAFAGMGESYLAEGRTRLSADSLSAALAIHRRLDSPEAARLAAHLSAVEDSESED